MSRHAYATIEQLCDPGYLGTGPKDQGYTTTLFRMLESASEEIDHTCLGRHYHCLEGTYYFDGSGRMFIPSDDILSISAFALDIDGDGTFESTLAATEYNMYPLNEYPKIYLKMAMNSSQGGFASGISSGVKITGVFGHGDGQSATPYYDSGITATAATAIATSLALSAEGTIQQGHTIRVESEQMYVTAVTSNGGKTATVIRGVNGTTAAAHAAKAVSIYTYPGPVTEATLILATAWWKQRENPATFMAGNNVTGTYSISKDIEGIIKGKLDHHIKKKLI